MYTSTTFFFSFHLFFLFYVHFSRIFYIVDRLKKSRRIDDAVDVRAFCPSEAAKLQYWLLIIPFFCLLCTYMYTSTTFFFSFHLFFLFYVHFSHIFYVEVRLKKSRRNDGDAVDVRGLFVRSSKIAILVFVTLV